MTKPKDSKKQKAMNSITKNRVEQWLSGPYDQTTKNTIESLIQENPAELEESFYRTLEFGTGGLRGIMGVGTNRMNIYTVGMATQGLANYIKRECNGGISVAIAYDCRNNSELFARTTAEVFAGNGFTVYLFESLRPTPELSFAVRRMGCKAGIVITASHNPKEYNGYKAYWGDGGQVVAPHDTNIIEEVDKITGPQQVKKDIEGAGGKIIMIGGEMDQRYIEMIKALSLSPDAVQKHSDLNIVYTPIHGTGVELVPMALRAYGFENLHTVVEQDVVDGNFPTVSSPNPEETAALKMAVELADRVGADLVMATDPDADRQAVAVRDFEGNIQLLNGNQCAALLTYYILKRNKELGRIKGNEFVVSTIVTTPMIPKIAEGFGVESMEVLTGFKFIADAILQNEGVKQFLCGGEESYGFLVGDSVRDKDAVASLAMAAECAAWAKEQGKGLWQLLLEMYVEYGLYMESLLSITKKGQQGVEEIKGMMTQFRTNPPVNLGGSTVVEVRDYSTSKAMVRGTEKAIHLPKSDVLQFVTEDGTIVSVRPSGTEPKIKFYFAVCGELTDTNSYNSASAELLQKIENIKTELSL